MKPVIEKLLYTEQGNILISIITGLGLAFLFKPICKDCKQMISPDLRKEDGKTYNINGTCYKNTVIPNKCDGTELPKSIS